MNTFLRRIPAAAVLLGTLFTAAAAFATPTISITSPASGSTIPSISSPAGFTISATATATAGSSIASVQFFDNGVSLGTVGGTSPFTINWQPTAAGSHTITATVTDNSVPTTGTSPSVNTATATSIVSVTTVRTATVAASSGGVSVTQDSEIFFRAGATISDAVIGKVDFLIDGVTLVSAAKTQAPYNSAVVLSAANGFTVGAHSVTAVATSSDNSITVTSPTLTLNIAAPVPGNAPPTVSITAPAGGTSLTVNGNVTVTATASDSDGFIPSTAGGGVTFFADGDPIVPVGSGETNPKLVAPYTITWRPTVTKSVSLRAQTIDDKNNIVLSSAIVVSVVGTLPTPTVSLTSPASGATLGLGSAVSLSATAAATGGATVSKVDFFAGSTQVGTTTTPTGGAYTVSWTPTTAGAVSLTARVTDSNGTTVTSTAVNATVSAAAPTVSISSPTNGAALAFGASTTLTANAAATGGASISRVDFLAGSTVIGTALTSPYTINWTPTTAGIVALTARATDTNGTSATSTIVNVNVTVPSVSLTGPANNAVVTAGSAVNLVASASAISPATVAKVDFFAGTTLVGTANTPAYAVVWTPTTPGAVSLTARVTDSNGASTTSTAINVNVVAGSGPAVSITSPANGATLSLNAATTLAASATPGAGNTITRVDFLSGTTTIGTALSAPYSISWTPTAAGVAALTARVTDSSGATATSAAVNVNVASPTITLTSPTVGSLVAVGSAVTVSASASPGSGVTVAQVQFLAGTSIIGTVTAAPYSVSWTPTTAGNVALTARMLDSNGNSTTSSVVTVTAVSGASAAVVITSPANGATLSLNAATTLTASATPGAGNTIARVDFLSGTTTIGTALSAPYSISWTPTVAAVASLTARVTDSSGATATSPAVNVTVSSSAGLGVTLALTGSSTIPVGSTRVITATPNGGSGAFDRVELYFSSTTGIFGAALVATRTTSPYTFLFTAPTALGNGFLIAHVVDSAGNDAVSPAFPVTIANAVGTLPVASIAVPSSGAFVAAGAATTISGTASDADGSINGVQVFVNGTATGLAGSGVAALAGSNWSIAWTPSATGVASITAIATDNSGNSVAAQPVVVNIADSASPAIALSLSPRTATTPASTTFPSGAVRNFVADVTPSSGRAVVRVEFFVDGTKVGEDVTAPYTFRYVAPALATGEQSHSYVLSARATDNAGAARDVQLPLLIVSPIGQPPAINLLTPTNGASVFPNTAISLAATAVANGGTIASVQFYVNGNPAPVNGGNAIAAAPYTATFTPTAPGAYVIDAIATDDRGNTTVSNSATITAAFATPTVTITAPTPSAVARAIPGVPLNLAASAVVQGGTGAAILLVEFLLDYKSPGEPGVQIGARTAAPYTFSWVPTTAQLGSHTITARVTDTNSQTATSAPVTVNVAALVGTPPTISISTSPIPAQGLQTLSQVNFIANASSSTSGVTIANVEFFLNDVSIGLAAREQQSNIYRLVYDFSRFDFSTAPSVTDPNTGVTRYTPIPLYAIARDSNSNQTVSPTANLTINPSTSLPPQVQPVQNLLAPTTTITQGQQFPAGIISSDPDGTVALIQLYANGSVVASQANPAQGQVLFWTPSVTGRFNLVAVATDDTGNTSVSSPATTIQVDPVVAPTTSITRPSDDSTVTSVGAPVFLEGTATSASANQVPTLTFIVTGTGGANRTQLTGQRVGTTNTYRQIWTPTVPDTYTIITQANVGVAQSTSTISRRVVVTNLQGLAPTISISVPSSVTTASTANFTATATDSDGSVVEVEFFLNRNSIGLAKRDQLANTWRITASFIGVPPGSAEVVAIARDSSGNVAASGANSATPSVITPSIVTVVAASSIAPSIVITPSTTNAAFNRQVQLRANARDTDGTVTNVQYFANATSLGSSGNAGTSYQVNWTPTLSGTFNVWAVATDDTGNTTVAPTVEITVRRNNPILEDAAFILQSYQDIANTTTINPIVFDDLDAQLSAGTISRADLIVRLSTDPAFTTAVNVLAAYYVLMGQWPTPSNYTSVLANARNNGLASAIGSAGQGQGTILGSNEYFAKFGVVPTTQLLNSPTSTIPADTFIARLWQGAGLGSPDALANLQFRNNNTLSATLGRGYNTVGLQQALAEFITNTNSGNTALLDKARAAALYYQLDRPPVATTVDQITARIATLVQLGTDATRGMAPGTDRNAAFVKPVAEAALKDILYNYRYVTITKQPTSLTVAPRSGVLFSVEAQGAPPLAYQWLLNGAPIPGATSALLSLTNVDATRVGTYTVSVTSSAATATSDPATLTLSSAPTKLGNISTRGVTTGGANVLIGGFVVTGANAQQTRQMLIRVVGPTLANAPFNVGGVLANPRLEVYAGSSATPVLTNDDWGTQAGGAAQVTAIQQATQRVAAFPLPNNSLDAAVLATLPPGNYTVQAKGPANTPAATGVVLIEVYDVTPNLAAPGRAVNVSTRGSVGTGGNILIAGFVVNGAVSRRVLVRGAGPTLTSLGVPGVLADPQLALVDQATGKTIQTNDDWAAGEDAAIIAAAARSAGAFPFASGSKDAAMIVMLPPGAYTAQLSGANGGTGVGIVEVYDVDP